MGSKTTYFCDHCKMDLDGVQGLSVTVTSSHLYGSSTRHRDKLRGYCDKCHGLKLVEVCDAIDEILGAD